MGRRQNGPQDPIQETTEKFQMVYDGVCAKTRVVREGRRAHKGQLTRGRQSGPKHKCSEKTVSLSSHGASVHCRLPAFGM